MDLDIPPIHQPFGSGALGPQRGGHPVVGERRQCAARHRVSWTAPLPYVPSSPLTTASARTAAPPVPADPVRAAAARRSAWQRRLIVQAVLGDLLCAIAVALVTVLTHDRTFAVPEAGGVLLVAAAWTALLLLTGGYDPGRLGDGPEELQAVVRCAVWLLAGLSVLALTTRYDPPRRYILIAVPALALLTAVRRQFLRKRLHRARVRGHGLLRTLVVGEAAAVERYSADLNTERYHGYDVAGACLTAGSRDLAHPLLPVRGTFSEVPQIVAVAMVLRERAATARAPGVPLRPV